MLTLALALACAGHNKPDATPAPSASTETRTLTLDPAALRWDEAAGTVTFEPGRDVQSAQYTTYILDLHSVEAALGGRPTSPVAVEVELAPCAEKRVTPEDPSLPSPQGGFLYTTCTGRALRQAP